MKSGLRPAVGFTIIEVLIVLAVSMALLAAAILLVSGKQNHTEFGQGVRQIQQELQQTINEVANGYYTSDQSFICSKGVNSPVLDEPLSGGAPRGTNAGCVFLGKAIQFGVYSSSGSAIDPEPFITYTMVGLQGSESSGVTDLTALKPLVVAHEPTFSPNISPTNTSVFDTAVMPFGMTVLFVEYGPGAIGSGTHIGAVGFASSVGQFGNDSSQQVNVLAIKGTNLHKSQTTGVTEIDTTINKNISPNIAAINPASGVRICVLSGGTKESALYTIGGGAKNTTVSVAVKEDTTCT